jgi:hypothetical protein
VSTLPRPRAARARGGPRYPEEDLVLGRYRLLAPIGSGGHGTVWVAADEQRPRRVAVKRVPVSGDHPNERARLAREGRAAARLEHPAIVTLLETGEDPAAHYIVCELVEGSSLASHYRENGLEDRAVIEICAAVAEALIHAHGRGVVHRDVKPQNVIVPSEPAQAGTPAKLTDFGVARIAGEQSLTATGEVIGTFEYMSPEQALGRPAGPPSDLYSLALTLYEGLTGANPLRGETVAATAARIGTPVEPLKDRRPDLPARLCRAVDQALAPEPARRGTLEELRDALESALVERAPRRPLALPALVRIPLTPRTGRFLAAAGAAALAASLTATLAPQQGASIALAAAALSAVLTAASPALGWLLAALASLAWLGAAGQAGTALVLAAALVAAPALLPGRPRLWSLAVLAPLLGVAGIAACYPALAGRAARTTLSRAALGALGYWWLSAAETLSGRRLLFGVGAGTRPRGTWSGSLGRAVDHALAPLFTDGRLLTAVVWALAAAALPLIVRARGLKLRAAFAVAWAAALLVGSALLASHLGVARSPVTLPAVALAGLLAFLGAGIAFQERPDVA